MEQGKAEKTKEPAYYATTTPMNIKEQILTARHRTISNTYRSKRRLVHT